ncbi:hypothetical protein F5Y11DRAFT_346627 [Daldinia sp. FL1419]|nr:hypothetical protein F5Y11DRAFT_346627 [Daldinia sp. FL1419]
MGLRLSKVVAQICTSPLQVDDFSWFQSRKNSLRLKASDDDSMISISVFGDGIRFHPRPLSYYYESLPCIDAEASGYDALAFTMKAPSDGSITLEMQTTDDCSTEAYNSTWRYVVNFTGEAQKIVAPISSFEGAKTNGIAAFNWATWESHNKDFDWELSDIKLTCNGKA